MEGELVEVDGLLAGLAAPCPALEDRLQQPHGLLEGETVDGANLDYRCANSTEVLGRVSGRGTCS
jgi:hypothetical protein